MKSMVRYGLFASALAAAAFLGHFFTERGYEIRGNEIHAGKIADTDSNHSKIKYGAGVDTGLEQGSHLEAKGHLGQISGAEPAIKNSELKAGSAINPDSTAASPLAKTRVDQAAPQPRPSAQLKKELVDKPGSGDQKNAVGNQDAGVQSSVQNAPALDETVSRPIEVANAPNREYASLGSSSEDSANSGVDMLAILSPLLKLADGKPLGAEAIEDKSLLVVAWASWCTGCWKQLSIIDVLKKKLNNPGLEVIVLSLDENLDDIRRVIATRPIDYPIVMLDQRGVDRLQLNGLPSVYMVNSRGRLRVEIRGDESLAVYEQRILSVLAEAPGHREKPSIVLKLAEGEAEPRL